MALQEQWDDDYEDDDYEDEGNTYFSDLKEEIASRSPEENVAIALDHIGINWRRHGEDARDEVALILIQLGILAEHAPSELQQIKHVSGSSKNIPVVTKIGEILDLDNFEESYFEITRDFLSEAERNEDIKRFKAELSALPNASFDKGRLSGVKRQAVRDVFTPLFGEDVNSEELALNLRKYLELSFI
jgi:hypothetical protein